MVWKDARGRVCREPENYEDLEERFKPGYMEEAILKWVQPGETILGRHESEIESCKFVSGKWYPRTGWSAFEEHLRTLGKDQATDAIKSLFDSLPTPNDTVFDTVVLAWRYVTDHSSGLEPLRAQIDYNGKVQPWLKSNPLRTRHIEIIQTNWKVNPYELLPSDMTPKTFGITLLQYLATMSKHIGKDEAHLKLKQQVIGRRTSPTAKNKEKTLQFCDVDIIKKRVVPKKSPGSQSSSTGTKRPRSKSIVDSTLGDSDHEDERPSKRLRSTTPSEAAGSQHPREGSPIDSEIDPTLNKDDDATQPGSTMSN
ncbi:hypothetical protein FFLO_06555 [Filobasidium floriforme]|uniref:Uncharacterized protein n=1 Tax=Filobasidium floriforme TaxID=5210 RepID=A0A8K0NM19_9TREE|nr:hypothetical protein FFLO_06555 [Filobasidium floriforme]